MNKTVRLSKSGIEYLDYAWSFYSGCRNWKTGVCPVGENCWAKKTTERFPDHYPNRFEPTFYPEAFLSPLYLKKPSIIGCAFMGDLFGDWVDPDKMINVPMVPGLSQAEPLKEQVFRTIIWCPQHTFLFKTKCPQNLARWSPFPPNCWPGVTATDALHFAEACGYLRDIEAKVKYLSIEPYLGEIIGSEMDTMLMQMAGIKWVIIGAMSCGGGELSRLASQYPQLTPMPYGKRYTLQPSIEWVEEIVRAAGQAGAKVFLKDNLQPLYCKAYDKPGIKFRLRQELPSEVPGV